VGDDVEKARYFSLERQGLIGHRYTHKELREDGADVRSAATCVKGSRPRRLGGRSTGKHPANQTDFYRPRPQWTRRWEYGNIIMISRFKTAAAALAVVGVISVGALPALAQAQPARPAAPAQPSVSDKSVKSDKKDATKKAKKSAKKTKKKDSKPT
jgi:hypothetical protein